MRGLCNYIDHPYSLSSNRRSMSFDTIERKSSLNLTSKFFISNIDYDTTLVRWSIASFSFWCFSLEKEKHHYYVIANEMTTDTLNKKELQISDVAFFLYVRVSNLNLFLFRNPIRLTKKTIDLLSMNSTGYIKISYSTIWINYQKIKVYTLSFLTILKYSWGLPCYCGLHNRPRFPYLQRSIPYTLSLTLFYFHFEQFFLQVLDFDVEVLEKQNNEW